MTPDSWKSAESLSGITMDDKSHHIVLVDGEAQRALWDLLQLCPWPAPAQSPPGCETHITCPWSCPDVLAGKTLWTQGLAHTGRRHQCIWPLGLTLEEIQMVSQKAHGGGGMGAREGESLSSPGIATAV